MTKDEFYQAARQELRAVERGEATVRLTAGEILLGDVEYRTSHGWTIVVFSDGGDWDFVRAIIPPSGEPFPIWPHSEADDCEDMRTLRAYHPPGDQAKTIWGFLS